jgi:hypothetical protein
LYRPYSLSASWTERTSCLAKTGRGDVATTLLVGDLSPPERMLLACIIHQPRGILGRSPVISERTRSVLLDIRRVCLPRSSVCSLRSDGRFPQSARDVMNNAGPAHILQDAWRHPGLLEANSDAAARGACFLLTVHSPRSPARAICRGRRPFTDGPQIRTTNRGTGR